MNTHNVKCDFGKHKGELYTRIPVNYLLWMVNAKHEKSNIAEAELNRRGTTMPELDLSGHVIDRASQKLLDLWLGETGRKQGLYSWLHDQAKKALGCPTDDNGRHIHLGYKWVFELSGEWPVLKTII